MCQGLPGKAWSLWHWVSNVLNAWKLPWSPLPLQWGLGVTPRPPFGVVISSSLVLTGRHFITVGALQFEPELSKDPAETADLCMWKTAAISILENVVLAVWADLRKSLIINLPVFPLYINQYLHFPLFLIHFILWFISHTGAKLFRYRRPHDAQLLQMACR